MRVSGQAGRTSVTAAGQQLISIVEADPDLGDLLDEGELERARHEALTRVQRLSPGEWDAARRWSRPPITAAS